MTAPLTARQRKALQCLAGTIPPRPSTRREAKAEALALWQAGYIAPAGWRITPKGTQALTDRDGGA